MQTGFGTTVGFIERLQSVTGNDDYSLTRLPALQLTRACDSDFCASLVFG